MWNRTGRGCCCISNDVSSAKCSKSKFASLAALLAKMLEIDDERERISYFIDPGTHCPFLFDNKTTILIMPSLRDEE